jgi:hypothetical protein
MRKSMILMAAIAALCLVAGAGHAEQVQVKLTQEQVATTCGSLIVTAEGGRRGCKKGCGEGKTCGFSCDKDGKDCKGVVVQFTGSSSGSPVNPAFKGGLLDSGPSGFSTQGPAKTGGAPAAPAPAPVQLR